MPNIFFKATLCGISEPLVVVSFETIVPSGVCEPSFVGLSFSVRQLLKNNTVRDKITVNLQDTSIFAVFADGTFIWSRHKDNFFTTACRHELPVIFPLNKTARFFFLIRKPGCCIYKNKEIFKHLLNLNAV